MVQGQARECAGHHKRRPGEGSVPAAKDYNSSISNPSRIVREGKGWMVRNCIRAAAPKAGPGAVTACDEAFMKPPEGRGIEMNTLAPVVSILPSVIHGGGGAAAPSHPGVVR